MPTSSAEATAVAPLDPLLVGSDGAARLAGLSRSMWLKLARQERCPAPLVIGAKKLWRVSDIQDWVDAGCPARAEVC